MPVQLQHQQEQPQLLLMEFQLDQREQLMFQMVPLPQPDQMPYKPLHLLELMAYQQQLQELFPLLYQLLPDHQPSPLMDVQL